MRTDDCDQVMVIYQVDQEMRDYIAGARKKKGLIHVFGRPYTVIRYAYESTRSVENEDTEASIKWRLRVGLKVF